MRDLLYVILLPSVALECGAPYKLTQGNHTQYKYYSLVACESLIWNLNICSDIMSAFIRIANPLVETT